ncbi:golgin subfamily A member 6-like protein 1 [Macrobrachium nipponense]|uniref:golgin subfamily A member 6-like protein 1 n=1 Tax=Macrobrachium nipponense TaxID=159736 RepID=UPI0030C89F2E
MFEERQLTREPVSCSVPVTMATASFGSMATKITKWTREKGGRKDFVDATRRSHQALTYHLTENETNKMKELARCDKTRESEGKEGKIEAKEDAVIRRRIEKLRAQLHSFSVGETNKVSVEKSPSEGGDAPTRSLKELKEEAKKRKDLLRTARSYIPPTAQPITPKQRGQRIHTKVLAGRAVQVREKQERIREREEYDSKWAERVIENHEKYEDDKWREKLERIEKKEKLKKDLDEQCVELARRRKTAWANLVDVRKDIELSDQLHEKHQQHWKTESNKAKLQYREKARQEIQDINDRKLQEALRDEELKAEDLRYSAFKRAYARRVKQRILDKMHGRRPTTQV